MLDKKLKENVIEKNPILENISNKSSNKKKTWNKYEGITNWKIALKI